MAGCRGGVLRDATMLLLDGVKSDYCLLGQFWREEKDSSQLLSPSLFSTWHTSCRAIAITNFKLTIYTYYAYTAYMRLHHHDHGEVIRQGTSADKRKHREAVRSLLHRT